MNNHNLPSSSTSDCSTRNLPFIGVVICKYITSCNFHITLSLSKMFTYNI